jgi:nucleotide-binding universal stress UspA family protein
MGAHVTATEAARTKRDSGVAAEGVGVGYRQLAPIALPRWTAEAASEARWRTAMPGVLAGKASPVGSLAGLVVTDLKVALEASAEGHLVLFVPPGARIPARTRLILVPHDGNPSTTLALDKASEIAELGHGAIVVLHVASAELPTEPGSLPAPRFMDHSGHNWQEWREEFTRRFCRSTPRILPRLKVAVGSPAPSILEAARRLSADLTVLGWRGMLEPGRAQTLRSVCLAAPCPVLLVAIPRPEASHPTIPLSRPTAFEGSPGPIRELARR